MDLCPHVDLKGEMKMEKEFKVTYRLNYKGTNKPFEGTNWMNYAYIMATDRDSAHASLAAEFPMFDVVVVAVAEAA